MALWKPFRGTSAALANVPKTDGYVYFCTDDGSLFFDYKDENNELHRKQITAKELTPVNLLDEPFVINTLENPADANYVFLDRSFGFTLGGTYILNYTYKGITKDITLIGYSQPQAGMGDEDTGVVIPQERMGQDFSFYTDDNGSSSDASGSFAVMIMDKCQATAEGIAYSENSAIMIFLANAENYALPFTINSIIAVPNTSCIEDIAITGTTFTIIMKDGTTAATEIDTAELIEAAPANGVFGVQMPAWSSGTLMLAPTQWTVGTAGSSILTATGLYEFFCTIGTATHTALLEYSGSPAYSTAMFDCSNSTNSIARIFVDSTGIVRLFSAALRENSSETELTSSIWYRKLGDTATDTPEVLM